MSEKGVEGIERVGARQKVLQLASGAAPSAGSVESGISMVVSASDGDIDAAPDWVLQ
ncbi:hypothetical protein PF005_g27921 [Phytophthora fragariae]|uniref:Uncharacterized protein n=2 Tax=Phytophthora TaxID=4783 RepID=A0A6A3VPD3_9STRA|nr:hypothetical protein PF009_g29438 [Phytophthora fragariae]KAE8964309.1 hypothetical protein PR001_g29093 [Phytophthora rubi]KAE8972181.1 hypothetical protein PF011_g25734 [Phytophthora fragariae]KAE8972347.1 hypothetical protein PR002_g26544 [Phytophthora rubi]KAE9066129.1 hypothetical protein PF010_g27923 [Phytophthora fragariae]